MNLINQHILDHFPHFQDEEDAFFQDIVELFQNEVKDKYWILLRYIHLLLDEIFSEETSETKILHLHFTSDFDDDSLLIIAQYLLIRFFKVSCTTAISSSQSNEKIESLKTNLRSRLKKLYVQMVQVERMEETESIKNGLRRKKT
jgi:hypothetical protein